MQLVQLIYASKKAENFNRQDIEAILACSRENNVKQAITGVLCFSQDFFLQCLEGGRAEVNALYTRITHDPRHLQPYIIDYSEIAERSFSKWAMGYLPETQVSRELVLRYSAVDEFDPAHLSAAGALGFLRSLSATI